MHVRRVAGVSIVLMLLLSCHLARAQSKVAQPKITVTGKLTRVMAIGGESTGWSIQFDSHTAVDGKNVDSLEVRFTDPKQAAKYENQHVKITGIVTTVHGVETGSRAVLEVTSIKGAKPAKPAS